MPVEEQLHQELNDAITADEFAVLEEAFKDAPVETPADPEAKPDRTPDGRFAAKEEPKDDKVVEPQADPKLAVGEEPGEIKDGDKDADTVPRWRLRELAEERKQAKAEADALRVELARLQAQPPQTQPEQQKQEIDPLIDPQGFVRQMREEFQAELRKEALNSNLALAHMRHGEKFEKAYEALIGEGQRGNHQLVQQLTRTGNPGEAIVRWHQQGELLRETGGDLGKFKDGLKAQLMKDPEFRKAFIEQIKAEANGGGGPQQQQTGARNVTRLPPSLARVNSGSPNSDPVDTDDSDAAVFDYAFK